MKRYEIYFSLLKIPLEFLIIFGTFFLSRNLRSIDDLVPWVSLDNHYISNENLFPFALFGAVLYIVLFSIHGLYQIKMVSSKVKEFLDIILYGIYFFLFYSVFIYFTKEIVYEVSLPRLIIIYTTILGTIFVISERIILNRLQSFLLSKGIIPKRNIALITNQNEDKIKHIIKDTKNSSVYNIIGYTNTRELNLGLKYLGGFHSFLAILQSREIDEVLHISDEFTNGERYKIWDYCRIHGVRYRYITNSFDLTRLNATISLINQIPVIELKNTEILGWGRVIKRLFDLIVRVIALIVLLPIFIIIGILIKLEDSKGPIIFKNKRVGQNGKEFILYKFRYLRWEYSIKDGYGVDKGDDQALKYERELIKKQSSRKGPLYKIENDPRKTKIGAFIEKYSIDELPQLFNVLIGNMSLVGPRPHQPREVEKYKLSQKRVFTIKPGITGISQVNGRENNAFEDEVRLDISYIENWSFLLDLKIIFKTFIIIFNRGKKKGEK